MSLGTQSGSIWKKSRMERRSKNLMLMRHANNLDMRRCTNIIGLDPRPRIFLTCISLLLNTNNYPTRSIPCLFLTALDDPISNQECIPYLEIASNPNAVLVITRLGGHLGIYFIHLY